MAETNVKVTFQCPVEKVWDTVTDLSRYQWRSDIERIEIVDEQNFMEISREGIRTYFTVIDKKPYERWEFTLENENIKGKWVGLFYQHGADTTLDFTEQVSAKNIMKVPMLGAYLRKQQRQYFTDLKRELGCGEAGETQVF